MSVAVEDAMVVLSDTQGIEEIEHPFEGGNHVFRYEEVATPDGPPKVEVFLDLADETYAIGKKGLYSAIKRVPGGSESMVNTWPLFMAIEPLNYFFDHGQGSFKALVKDNVLLSVTKPTATLFDPRQVLEIMAETVARHSGHSADTIEVDDLVHSMEETAFTVVDPEGSRFIEAREGDRTLGALGFSGSLLGRKKMTLDVRTRRILCRNGMVSPDGVSHYRPGNEDEDGEEGGIGRLEEWLRSQTEDLFSGADLDRELARIQHLTEHPIDDQHVGSTLEDLFQRFSVPGPSQAAVIEALEEERDGTMYGIVQAFTRAAQHSPTLADAARNGLMHSAGLVAYRAQEICASCQRVL